MGERDGGMLRMTMYWCGGLRNPAPLIDLLFLVDSSISELSLTLTSSSVVTHFAYNDSSNGSRPAAALTVEFDCPTGGFSGLRVAGLKLLNENYSIYKGVKITGRGKVEVRCI